MRAPGTERTPAPVELLAPAGDDAALQAALSAGADAVYLGLERWSARAFAANFAGAALPAAIDRAHLFGARVHLALNTLLKDDELELALAALAAPYQAGLDALIVADLGFAALVRDRYTDLELHASTQLNTHASPQLALLAELGFKRAILARELSLDEIAALDAHGMDLEVFVHGALCYGYSGLCLFSSMVGGRSGNRGRCSQSCRMRYRLVAGGPDADEPVSRPEEKAARGGRRRGGRKGGGPRGSAAEDDLERVLSTSDLAAIESLPALIRAGVSSFKIEGRMKDAGYVAVATSVYREALDEAFADPGSYRARPEWLSRLGQSFSRGFTNAHLRGRHATVRSAGRGGHRGVPVGRVEAVDEDRGLVTLRTSVPLRDGDVIVVYTAWGHTEPMRVAAWRGESDGSAPGAAKTAAERVAARTVVRLRERVAVKDRVFRLAAGELDEFTRMAVTARALARPVELDACIEGRVGERARLTLSLRTTGGDAVRPPRSVTVESDAPLQLARTVALDRERVQGALGALGGTPYRLAECEDRLEGPVFLSVAALKDLRRRAVAELDDQRLAELRRAAGPAVGRSAARRSPRPARRVGEAGGRDALPLILRLRPGEAPLVTDVAAVCLDLRGGDVLEDVTAAQASLAAAGFEVRCRPPEILFDSELDWWSTMAALGWTAVYARHAAHLVPGVSLILEYPLQGLNSRALPGLGASPSQPHVVGLVAGPEMSLAELEVLAGTSRPPIEVFGFGRQQLMVSRDELGRQEGLVASGPVLAHELSLVDGKGFVFPVTVNRDETRLYNARVTNLAPAAKELVAAGVRAFIVEQGALDAGEREALRARGLGGLAAAAARGRSTTGHLFRGVV